LGFLAFLVNVILTLRRPADQPNDPWGGNSLEWWTSSPPPDHDFDSLPPIRSVRPVYDARVAVERAAAERTGNGRSAAEEGAT
jgi:heme/copper-type cytochrome/quinol oxidase subunit 1